MYRKFIIFFIFFSVISGCTSSPKMYMISKDSISVGDVLTTEKIPLVVEHRFYYSYSDGADLTAYHAPSKTRILIHKTYVIESILEGAFEEVIPGKSTDLEWEARKSEVSFFVDLYSDVEIAYLGSESAAYPTNITIKFYDARSGNLVGMAYEQMQIDESSRLSPSEYNSEVLSEVRSAVKSLSKSVLEKRSTIVSTVAQSYRAYCPRRLSDIKSELMSYVSSPISDCESVGRLKNSYSKFYEMESSCNRFIKDFFDHREGAAAAVRKKILELDDKYCSS